MTKVVGLTQTASPEFLSVALMVLVKVTLCFYSDLCCSCTLLFQLSTLCVEENCHMHKALIEAVKVLCYSLRVCRLQRIYSSQSHL